MRQWIIQLAVAVAAAMMAAGCMPVTPLPQPVLPDALAEPVKIGVLLPLSGADSEYGERTLRGVEFACSELNNGRGISDRRVELLVRDTKSSPAEARRQVEELSRQGIAGLVGPYSTNEALAIKPAVEALLIPTVVPLATNDEITAGTRMIYRACFTDSQQGEALAAYAWYWRKLLRLAIVVNLDDMATYSRSVALEAANAFSDLGGSVVHTVEFEGDKKEFGQKLRELVSYGPQAILISGEPGRGLGYLGGSAACYVTFVLSCVSASGTGAPYYATTLALVSGIGFFVVNISSIVDAVRVAKVKNMYYSDLDNLAFNVDLTPYVDLAYAGTAKVQPVAGLSLRLSF